MTTVDAMTKDDWIERLSVPLGTREEMTRAQRWLSDGLRQHCPQVAGSDIFESIDDFVMWLLEQLEVARQKRTRLSKLYAEDAMPSEWMAQNPDAAHEAVEFTADLVAACRAIGGEQLGWEVEKLVFAERIMVQRRLREFILYVWKPLFARLIVRKDKPMRFELGDVLLTVAYDQRQHDWIVRLERQDVIVPSSVMFILPELNPRGLDAHLEWVSAPDVQTALEVLIRPISALKSGAVRPALT